MGKNRWTHPIIYCLHLPRRKLCCFWFVSLYLVRPSGQDNGSFVELPALTAEASAVGHCWRQDMVPAEPTLLMWSSPCRGNIQEEAGLHTFCLPLLGRRWQPGHASATGAPREEVPRHLVSPVRGAKGNQTAAPPYLARLLVKYTQSHGDWVRAIKNAAHCL